jgi:hypothetical protein
MMSTNTRAEREAALAANDKSPLRTLRALQLLSDVELANLETHVRSLEAGDPYGTPPDGYARALAQRAGKEA